MIQLDNKVGDIVTYYYISQGVVYKKINDQLVKMPGWYLFFANLSTRAYNSSPDAAVATAMEFLGLGKITYNSSKVINEKVISNSTRKNQ